MGFDGIELHAAHGFYLNQVIETSERTDGYGGTFNCRVRLLSELIQEIRQQCGTDFIIAVRFGSHSTDELIAASCVKKEVSLPVICVIPHGAIKFCMAKNQQNVYIAEIVCGI